MTLKLTRTALALLAVGVLVGAAPAEVRAADADYHHVHITSSAPPESVRWYARHLDCAPIADRDDTADCYGVEVTFVPQPTMGSTQGTGVNHIGFSYPDLTAKMAELEEIGVRGSGVRLQRFPGGATLRESPGGYLHGYIFDPWGTRIEMVEDQEYLGFHHVHLSAADPQATLGWYQQMFGGERAVHAGQEEGLRFDSVWLFASEHPEGAPATTEGRAIDHIGFVVDDIEAAAAELRDAGVEFQEDPVVPENARAAVPRAFIHGPDNVRLALVETGFVGVDATGTAPVFADVTEPYDTPRTPWGEPDLQGVWTGNASHGIPLERPLDLTEIEALTPEQATARRERGTLGSIWGYEREWRDTTLGYDKNAPSTQVAMIIDPPDGRIPALTPEGERRAAQVASDRARYTTTNIAGPEEATSFVRCITRGLPGLMFPGVYNNGLQIYQGPGFVAIQKEMIHETRVIPTTPRPKDGPQLTSWLGSAQGQWEGDTLVVETTNLNARASYRGSSPDMVLTERFTRISPTRLEFQFTVDDPAVWTAPYTGRFTFDIDDEQYELVEYACHEGNYGMFNILSGARARDREAAEADGR